MQASLHASDGALAAIISESHAGLSALQFQDVCAQTLLQIDQWQAAALRDVAVALDTDAEIESALGAVSTEEQILDHGKGGELFVF